MTVTLAYDDTLARVTINADELGLADAATVERSTDQIRWTTVRGAVDLDVTGGMLITGTTSLKDYEFAPNVLNYYRVSALETGLYLPGVAGANASTPDATPLDITGDIDIRIDLTADSYASGTYQILVGKWASPQLSYRMALTDIGEVQFAWTPDGTSASGVTSTELVPAAAGERIVLRVTFDVNNGASGKTTRFYTGETIDGPWTQLGDDVTSASTTSIFAGTAPLWIGEDNDGSTEMLVGIVHEMKVLNGIASSSTAGLYLSGIAGQYASTPDTAVLDIVGDLDLRADATIDDWTPTAGEVFVAKWTEPSNNRSYLFYLGTDGKLNLAWSTNGVATLSAASTVSTTPTSSGRLAVRVTLDVDNGAAGNTVTFYTASTMDGTWTQLGDPVIQGGVTSIFASAAVLEVGTHSAGTSGSLHGIVHAAEARNGIAGTVVANPDFSAQAVGTTSFADTAGRTWTMNGGAAIFGEVANPDFEAQTNIDTSFVDDAGRTWSVNSTAAIITSQTASITPDLTQIWLKSVTRPFLNRPIVTECAAMGENELELLVSGGSVTRRTRAAAHPIIGRTYPIAVTDIALSRSWTMRLRTWNATALTTLDYLFASGDVIFIQVPAGCPETVEHGYVVAYDPSYTRHHRYPSRAIWDVALEEVAPPTADITYAENTWTTVINAYASWADLVAANASWNDVLALIPDPSEVIVP